VQPTQVVRTTSQVENGTPALAQMNPAAGKLPASR
jgi:hypothetical protein